MRSATMTRKTVILITASGAAPVEAPSRLRMVAVEEALPRLPQQKRLRRVETLQQVPRKARDRSTSPARSRPPPPLLQLHERHHRLHLRAMSLRLRPPLSLPSHAPRLEDVAEKGEAVTLLMTTV